MQYPAFFDKGKPIVLYDPLAEFLGATKAGMVEYTYLDAVKLAGHSCPTVAGACRMSLVENLVIDAPSLGRVVGDRSKIRLFKDLLRN